MRTLLSMGFFVSALLVLAHVVGSELSVPAARHALRTGDRGSLSFACKLVAAGEWAIITLCVSLLMLGERNWHLFTATPTGKRVGLFVAALVLGLIFREIAGHWRKRYAGIISTSLNLVLPESGGQRELYERVRQSLENGSVAEQDRAVKDLLAKQQG